MTLGAQLMTNDRETVWLRLRRTIALPIYAVALTLDFMSEALGRPAA
jgi:hypothetical protein